MIKKIIPILIFIFLTVFVVGGFFLFREQYKTSKTTDFEIQNSTVKKLNQAELDAYKERMQGYWESIEEPRYSINISEDQLTTFFAYEGELPETNRYKLINYSCDSGYLSPEEGGVVFILEYNDVYYEPLCQELYFSKNP